MVIADLYAPRGAAAALEAATSAAQLPGIAAVARFGERRPLAAGWRPWLAQWSGRTELAAVAPAWIAAARAGVAAAGGALWIASPLHLRASLTRVHLEHHGLLRLPAADAAAFAADYALALGEDGTRLVALPSGDFLLSTPDLATVASAEPARFAGAMVPALPAGADAAPLRRRIAEIEMWLHAQASGTLVNALWLWGAAGAQLAPGARRSGVTPWRACGADAYLDGLMALQGARCEPLPRDLGALQAGAAADVVLALRVAEELQTKMPLSFLDGLARLDERFIAPAVAALRAGSLARLTLIANDHRLTLGPRSALKLWRRARAPLAALA